MKHFFKNVVTTILTLEARLLLWRTQPTIIAVTGNVGKTSTKDAIYHVLKDHVRARKSEKSFNSEIGVPLSILGLENAWSNPILWFKNLIDGLWLALFPGEYAKVLVLEMGVDRPGDMARLTRWIKPHIVVLTRLPDIPVHVEYFSTPDLVVAEKLELVKALQPDGVFVYNADDDKVRAVAESVRQRSLGYSRYSPSEFFAKSDDILYEGKLPSGLEFLVTHGGEQASFTIPGIVGVAHTYSVAAACAVASLFDISLAACAEAISTLTPPPGRMRIIPGLKDTTLIDDTYNSSPTACERALSTLYEIKGAKRRIAVLGDMLELGQYSVEAHSRVGEQVADGADVLFTVGVRSRGIAEKALALGFTEKRIFQFEDSVQAGRALEQYLEPGDVVLVKGSQSMRMERIVADVMAKPEEAETLLVRQSAAWQQKT